jgi:hypothetical protein
MGFTKMSLNQEQDSSLTPNPRHDFEYAPQLEHDKRRVPPLEPDTRRAPPLKCTLQAGKVIPYTLHLLGNTLGVSGVLRVIK